MKTYLNEFIPNDICIFKGKPFFFHVYITQLNVNCKHNPVINRWTTVDIVVIVYELIKNIWKMI
jgi:hypothetical protein